MIKNDGLYEKNPVKLVFKLIGKGCSLMRKYFIIATLFTLFLSQSSFAASYEDDLGKQCSMIADACKSAGFTNEDTGDKSFWFGCMKPVLHGKMVEGVTIDAKDVK